MKKIITLVLLAGFVSLWASEKGHDHKNHDHGATKSDKATTITGEVMDLTCYISHPDNGQGKDHAKCAQKCIKKGLPVGIKTKDGQLYIASGNDHKSANAQLAQYGGQVVSVTGKIKEQDGVKMIFVKEVKVAK